MGIKANFNIADIKQRFDRFLDVVEQKQIERLQYLGEQCVTIARELPPEVGFNDITGNLRSSIGYVIFKDGVVIRDNYTGSGTGASEGKALANSVGSGFGKGVALVVTAGMSYALHVESRGKDVLTSAEVYAVQELPSMIAELKANILKAMK